MQALFHKTKSYFMKNQGYVKDAKANISEKTINL
jgi:hypothetical protein